MRKIGSHPTPDQKRDIILRRSQIQDKVETFQRQAGSILHAVVNDADDSWGDDCSREAYSGAEFDGIGEEDDEELSSAAEGHNQPQLERNGPRDGHTDAEYISVHLPSHLGRSWCNSNAAD